MTRSRRDRPAKQDFDSALICAVKRYKNPYDSLSIDDFFKVIGYAMLFKSSGRTVNEIQLPDITVSLFRHTVPRELFRELQACGADLRKRHEGIYTVARLLPFPVQIVVTRELQGDAFSVFRVLAPDAKEADVRTFIGLARTSEDPGSRRNADAVFQVSASANRRLYDRLRRSTDMCDALMEIFQEEIAVKVEEGRQEGREEGRQEGREEGRQEGREEGRQEGREEGLEEGVILGAIETMRDDGRSDEDILARLMKKYGLSRKDAEGYLFAKV